MKSALFFIGPNAGASFHRHMAALNVLASGEKQWYMLPRATWFRGHLQIRQPGELFVKDAAPFGALKCRQRAGEAVYVPPGWFHAVRNMDVSVGITVQFGQAE